jgi:[ribosomal protein S5]-alanine N-acetyltransferase
MLGFLGFSPPTLRLVGERVLLRPPAGRDWREWAALRAESRDFLTPWEPTWSSDSLSRSSYRRRLTRHAMDWRADQAYTFFVFRKGDEALLGGIGFSNIRRGVAETASIGYWIGERYARRGFMAASLQLALRFGFEHLRLHRIEAACLPHNVASRELLRKTGFTEEGRAREYLCIDGKWQDHILFGLLVSEWRGRQAVGF